MLPCKNRHIFHIYHMRWKMLKDEFIRQKFYTLTVMMIAFC